MDKSKRLVIVGGIPSPFGGVTNFVYRLALCHASQIHSVIDLYPNTKKQTLPGVEVKVRPKPSLRALVWLGLLLKSCNNKTVYFNFSTPVALILMLCMPKPTSARWLITLHHGELGAAQGLVGSFLRLLAPLSLKKFDQVGFISTQQKEYFLANGVSPEKLSKISPFIPYPSQGISSTPAHLKKIQSKHDRLILTSGYPSSVYRYSWTLRAFRELRSENTGLILCVYGEDKENIMPYLRSELENDRQIYLFQGLNAEQFQSVLSICDIYVRPSLVDSFGVAVAESLECGLRVIASDACERYPGANIFPKDCQSEYKRLFGLALRDRLPQPKESSRRAPNSITEFLNN